MFAGPVRLSILAGFTAFGALGATLALMGAGLPFLLAAALTGIAAGLVQFAAAHRQAPPPPLATRPNTLADAAMIQQLAEYRAHTAALRHDLRGVLSPALMMSDRLVTHPDPTVQRAGVAVVRSIDRATALLTDSRDLMAPGTGPAPAVMETAAARGGPLPPPR